MDQETYERIAALERRLMRIENLICRGGTFEEQPAKMRNIMSLQRMVETNYVSKPELKELVYTKEECDKQYRKRSTIDKILEKRQE